MRPLHFGTGQATTEITVVRRHQLLRLQHHDRASLLAGKLRAILQRPYAKGRDFYDLVFYLSDPGWPAPNLRLLNNALAQTEWPGPPLTESTWVAALRTRLRSVKWDALAADVRPLLESPGDRELLTRETLTRLIDRRDATYRGTRRGCVVRSTGHK